MDRLPSTLAPVRPAANPGASYLAHRTELNHAVLNVLASGHYLQAGETAAFETELAAYLGVEHVITAGSGTDALVLALRVLGIGPGDAVATVSHTAVATVTAIDLVGALPVLIDVDPATYTLDPAKLEATLRSEGGSRIKAILPVHLYGHPARINEIMEIAARYGLPVLEDCAQSHGASLAGRRTGAWGAFGAFSFYPTKNLGAFGDGGALATSDARLAERARSLKQYGWKERYVSHLPGMNTRLDELQAAMLRVKLPYLDDDNNRRRAIAQSYHQILCDSPLELPAERFGCRHVYHQYVIRTQRRDDLAEYLSRRGIGTAVHYPVPVHRQPGYQDRVALGAGGLRHTEALCRRVLSLPMHPALTDAEVQEIGETTLRWTEEETA
jgi:dTDP-4-amino-4,6-dideoxygalactose transaminase